MIKVTSFGSYDFFNNKNESVKVVKKTGPRTTEEIASLDLKSLPRDDSANLGVDRAIISFLIDDGYKLIDILEITRLA
jgi:hypothetical protein